MTRALRQHLHLGHGRLVWHIESVSLSFEELWQGIHMALTRRQMCPRLRRVRLHSLRSVHRWCLDVPLPDNENKTFAQSVFRDQLTYVQVSTWYLQLALFASCCKSSRCIQAFEYKLCHGLIECGVWGIYRAVERVDA